ncbi:MAG TPA: SRPBCC family protein [Solirubrobacteraceae bacterium]
MILIEEQRRLPVSLQEGYDYITDPANWPEYWPRLVRVNSAIRWREPGDRASVTLRMLGRDVTLDMTLVQIDPYRVIEYTSEQRGLPSVRHRRRFEAAGEQLAYGIEVEYEPRPGWRGLLDRHLVRRAIERATHETITNLDQRFRRG